MFKQIRRYHIAAVFLLAVVILFAQGGKVSAHEGHTGPHEYTYTAREKDNLSKMVRRSIQLYAQSKNLTISEPAAMFCETKSVQQIGSRRLAISETVTVPFAVLEKYIEESKSLSPAAVAAWQQYSNRANFALAGLEPTNKTAADAAVKAPATPPSPPTNTDQDDENSEGSDADDTETASFKWYYAVLGLAALAIVYYLLGGRYKTPQPVTPPPKKTTRKKK